MTQREVIIMPKNPGNTGHRGYKMSKIIAIEPQKETVLITLECGHSHPIYPYHNCTPEEYAQDLQQGINPFVIGKTRVRCEEQH